MRSPRQRKLLAAADNPLIIVGGDAAVSGAEKEVLALAEMLGAPMRLETVDNTAPIPTAHPLFAGSITRLEPSIRKILDQHDVLMSIGGDIFTLSLPSDVHPLPDGLKIIHIDSDPWELGKNYPEAVAMVGDAKASIAELNAHSRHPHDAGPAQPRAPSAEPARIEKIADERASAARARPRGGPKIAADRRSR